MRMCTVLALVAGLMLAGGLALADEKEELIKKDLDKFAGNWMVTKAEQDSKPDKLYTDSTTVITGNKFSSKQGGEAWEGSFKLDPTKKPKTIEVTYTSGPNKGKSRFGIYEFEGDTFRISYSPFEKKEPPTEFSSKNGQMLIIAKKAK